MASGRAVMRLRSGFTLPHLQAALAAAQECYRIEQEAAGKKEGDWLDGMLRSVPVAIIMASAALEASANEHLQDALDRPTLFGVDESHRKLLAELKDDRTGNALIKFRRLALLTHKDPDIGTAAWENANLLVDFRNAFMHFRPAWNDDAIHNSKFVQQLGRKVPTLAAYKLEGNLFFPYGFMTYGCAKWAVRTAFAFSSEFSKVLGVEDKLARLWNAAKLP
jgi:hypothetical protein